MTTGSTIFFFHDKNNHRGSTMPVASDTTHDTAARPSGGGLFRLPRRWLARLWRVLRSIG